MSDGMRRMLTIEQVLAAVPVSRSTFEEILFFLEHGYLPDRKSVV